MLKSLRFWWWSRRLTHRDSEMRRAACEALGQLGDIRAVEPLIQRLEDGDLAVRL